MFVVVWSVKGGVGTSVVAAAASLWWSRTREVVLLDPWGDQSALFGVAPAEGAVAVAPGVSLVTKPPGADSAVSSQLRDLFETRGRDLVVVVDAGCAQHAVRSLAANGKVDASVLVLRPCYLALARAVVLGAPATHVALVEEPGRALRAGDVASVLGRPVSWRIPWHPSVARVVDSGLAPSRLLAALERSVLEP